MIIRMIKRVRLVKPREEFGVFFSTLTFFQSFLFLAFSLQIFLFSRTHL